MSAEGVIAGVVVGVATGVTSAIIAHKALKDLNALATQEAIEEARHAAFNDGWVSASNNANNVRQAYTRMFTEAEPEETEGTTLRSRGKRS
jgi:hypothetical protein